MSFGAGAFARAARSHETAGRACQDACAAEGGRQAIAIACDGCSDGVDSELVAQALRAAVLARWREGAPWSELGPTAWRSAREALKAVGVDADQGPSTLLMLSAKAGADGKAAVEAALWGDGAVAWGSPEKGLRGAWIGASPAGIPGYPAYAFDDGLWSEAAAQGAQSGWAPMEGFERGPQSDGRGWFGSFELEPGEVALVLTDGAMAIDGVGVGAVLERLVGARGPGAFLQRRARKALDDWSARGGRLGDDFGVAALRWEPWD